MSVDDAGGALVRRVESRIWLSLVAANFGGALIVSFDGVVGSILYPGHVARAKLLSLLALGAFGVYALAVATSRWLIVRPTLRPAVGWLAEQRPPTADEAAALARQPAKQAARFLVYWSFAVVVLYPYARLLVGYRPTPAAFYKAFIFVGLSAFFAGTLGYLLVERSIRPLLSRTLEANREVPPRLGILPRLLLGWAVVAGLPLASLAIELAGLDARQLAQSIPVMYGIGATSVVIGIVGSWIGAYALTDPIGKLSRALHAVADGDLDTEVEVNEAGELGEVQMGFNQMVAGLREQQRIRDLFRRHVGDEVARHTIEAGGQIAGERREVSVVFVDIVGSTALTQRHTPDDVVEILNRFFDLVVAAMTFQEGIVSKFEGDGVLGVFGAVSDQPDHAGRALRAARALRVELDALADALGAEAAIGVASGLAVAGHLGASDRYEFTVVGKPVDEAIRLCDAAKLTSSRLLVSEDTEKARDVIAPAVEVVARAAGPAPETTAALAPGRVVSVQRLRLSIMRTVVGATAIGSTYVGGVAMFFHHIYPAGVSSLRFASAIGVGYVVFALAIAPGYLTLRRMLRGVERWLTEDRAPTRAEVAELVRLPGRLASVPLPYWALTFLVVLVYQTNVLHYRIGTLAYLKEPTAFVLGAVIGWTMSYLLIERALRPILTIALASGEPLDTATLRTFPRLLLAWIASSGAPIAALAFALTGLTAHQRSLVVPLLYFGAVLAAVTGVLVVVVAARAVTDPLADVRKGLRRIADGDFDVVVPVNDGGEIGLLEAEVNRMARGLRERERDLQLFGRHVGHEVASRALVEHALGGERRTVSAMFVRIVTSPLIADDVAAEDVVAVFNGLFDAVVRAVAAEGGSVNKIKSDGALCLFGAPVSVDDHAARALRTARALMRELTPDDGLAVAIGVSTGDVVAGNVGAADRYEYTVIGDAVNEAARLTEHATNEPQRVLVSETTVRASGAESDGWIAAGEWHLRGRSGPTLAFSPAAI